jgi:hypothetical protein
MKRLPGVFTRRNGDSVKHPREKFVLELEALPGNVPAEIRLRHALKLFLRRFDLKCTRVSPGNASGVAQDASGHAEPPIVLPEISTP